MNSNGDCRTPLPIQPLPYPDWSPDGTKIAFGDGAIRIANADGSNLTAITQYEGNRSPDWSPDGQKIVFVSERDGNPEIYVMDADGSNQTNLTNNPWSDDNPAWSPDGSRIVFASNRNDSQGEPPYYTDLYLMDPDGDNVENLTNSPDGSEGEPDWAPDGSRIVFTSGLLGKIMIMDSDGANPVGIAEGSEPKWSPDGELIAFVLNTPPTGESDIFIMKPDGSEQTNLTYHMFGRNDQGHDWQPLPAPITGIDIGKVVRGQANDTGWVFSSEQLGDFMLPPNGGCASFEDLEPGTYTITEETVPGYDQAISCDNGQEGINSITLNFAQDQHISCTFFNSTRPSLTLFSTVQGPPPSSDLNISGDLGVFTMPAVGGEKLFEALLPGEYTFTVTPVIGFKTWISCTPENLVTQNTRTLEMVYGRDEECVITLNNQGSIALEVEVRGTPGPDDWQFNASPTIPNFSIPAAGGEIFFGNLEDDAYNFYVEPLQDFSSSASCSSGETGDWSVSASVYNGADITCKFIFTRLWNMMLPFLAGDTQNVKAVNTMLIERHFNVTEAD
jgi:TolB protein